MQDRTEIIGHVPLGHVDDWDELVTPDTGPDSARRRGLNPRTTLRIRRGIGLAIMLGIAYGIFHILFRTDLLEPLLAYVDPAKQLIDWVAADPKRAWGALAVVVIPHIGMYYLLFEDRK
ncbi:MAG: hypothetical protein DI630_29980 [Gordonia sp. (in: high G+C Gram-positive bacteria)]|nr:MAG: hypothetical protein DI630_29980 [Gordonia sp. (in: high G+C Gram-positive bacteria)]